MTRVLGVLVLATSFASASVAASGCATGEELLAYPVDASSSMPNDEDHTIPDASGTKRDAGKTDAGKDAATKDAGGIDWGTPRPSGPPTGSDCTKVGEEYENTCGQCGIQIALCLDGKVGAYGPCRNEKLGLGNCIPGTSSASACGYCGTKITACRNDCTWTETTCKGQVIASDRCMPGDIEQRVADCEDGEKRTFACTDTCTWGTPSSCIPSP
ncbi:hypothetical protein AKJ09_01275 [Labilithrix luteola]|uniref:Uncharacterized protein n=2 Tax=Labilithrix luteola TaxID=1391654 RepID=A0A0K1PMH1_9BACT|nr:hypothetical protein AKJ09_01275 [Labilithrix luteola]